MSKVETRPHSCFCLSLWCIILLPMECVQQPVDKGRKGDCRHDEKDQASIKRIEACKELPSCRCWCFHRTHAAEKHRRIEERVSPREPFEVHVASHSGG